MSASKVTLLFVHGSLLDYRYWQRELSYFSSHFRAIAAPGLSNIDDFNLASNMIVSGDAAKGVEQFMDAVCASRKWEAGSEEYRLMTIENAINVTEQVKESREPISAAELALIQLPVLLMLGELSDSPFPETLDRLVAVIPNAENAIIPGASHLVNVDNHKGFCESLSRFLAHT